MLFILFVLLLCWIATDCTAKVLHKQLYDTSICPHLPKSKEYTDLQCMAVEPVVEQTDLTFHDFTSRGLFTLQRDISHTLLSIRDILCSTPAPTILEHGCGVGRGLLEVRAVNPTAAVIGMNKQGYDFVQVNGVKNASDIRVWNIISKMYEIPMYSCNVAESTPFAPVYLLDNLIANNRSLEVQLPFDAEQFDFVYSQNALDAGKVYFGLSHRWMPKFLRVLKPGGVMVLGLTGFNKVGSVPKTDTEFELDHEGLEFVRYARFTYVDNSPAKRSDRRHSTVEMILFRSPGVYQKYRPFYCIVLKHAAQGQQAFAKPSTLFTKVREYMHKYRDYSYNKWEGDGFSGQLLRPQQRWKPGIPPTRKVSALEQILMETKVKTCAPEDSKHICRTHYEYAYYKNFLTFVNEWEMIDLYTV